MNIELAIYFVFILYNSTIIINNTLLKDKLLISPTISYLLCNVLLSYLFYINKLFFFIGMCIGNGVYCLIYIGQYIFYKCYYNPNTIEFYNLYNDIQN
jgi:hypothetical protein